MGRDQNSGPWRTGVKVILPQRDAEAQEVDHGGWWPPAQVLLRPRTQPGHGGANERGGGSGQGRGADCTVSQQAGPSLPP